MGSLRHVKLDAGRDGAAYAVKAMPIDDEGRVATMDATGKEATGVGQGDASGSHQGLRLRR